MWTGIARIILKNRIPILILLLLVTVFMGYNARQIRMSYQYAPLLPEDDPAFKQYESFVNNFGNEGNLLVIGVKDADFFTVSHFNNWNRFSE
jgi:predicted RND superfamily exporter protein